MDPDDDPPPGDPGELDHHDGNQLANQARYNYDIGVNMDPEETGTETVDFDTYAATLTASSTGRCRRWQQNSGNDVKEYGPS